MACGMGNCDGGAERELPDDIVKIYGDDAHNTHDAHLLSHKLDYITNGKFFSGNIQSLCQIGFCEMSLCLSLSNSNGCLSRVACDFQIIAIYTQETTKVEIFVQKISNLNVHLPLSLTCIKRILCMPVLGQL